MSSVFLAVSPRTVAAKLGAAGLAGLLLVTLAPAGAQADPVAAAPGVKPGRVVVFGGSGQLAVPTDLDDAVAVAATDDSGSYANLAIRANGTVVGWGDDTSGTLDVPAGLRNVVQVDITAGLAVALSADGALTVWGDNRSGSLDVPTDLGPVKAVAVGGNDLGDGPCNYVVAVKEDGSVVRWGQSDPELPCFDMSLDAPEDVSDVVSVSAADRGAVALRSDGSVVGWGRWFNTRWDGTNPSTWSDVTQVSMGGTSVLGLTEDGAIEQYGVWGESGPGNKGPATAVSAGSPDLSLTPTGQVVAYRSAPVPAGDGFQAVAAGSGYGLAIAAASGDNGGGAEVPEPSVGPAVGSDVVQPGVDSNPAGMAETFRATAARDLRARTMRVYVDESSTARQLIVGVYSDTRRGEPGRLLATGRTRELTAGAWNSIDISRVDIEAGQSYWLTVLTPHRRGTLVFRDLPDGQGGPTRTSAVTRLTARTGLPVKWRSGRHYGNAPASIHLR